MQQNDRQYLISVLQNSIKQNTASDLLPEDEEKLVSVILHSGILLTVYGGLSESLRNKLKLRYSTILKRLILQEYEGERVLQALSGAGFDCIALKGWEMRKLYPKPLMRQMADLDILVKPYDYARIRQVMETLGYTGGGESSWKHDSFIKGEVHIEMHKRLTDDSGVVQKWEEAMWTRTVPTETAHLLKMSPEDYYIFHFVHLHKDFMNGSLGLRRIVDTWLLQKQAIDADAVKAQLETFGLWTFHERMVKLSRVVMGDEPMDENCEILLEHAFRHGIFGSEVSYKAGRIAAMGKSVKSGKRRSAIAAVFLPYKRMKAQYPILEKWPVLLPWCWGRRIVHFLRADRKKNRARLDYSNIGEAEYREMKRFFEAGGINE